MSWLIGIGQWLLKIFLSGIGVKMGQEETKKAEMQRDAAVVTAETIRESADAEKKAILEQQRIRDEAAKEKEKPVNPTDVTGANDWNAGR
jgi:hypothetical protein